MDDEKIIELYFARDEQAVRETETRYGSMLRRAAENVLGSPEEAEEVANDVLFRAWNSIPPERPRFFGAWLKKLARRAAIDVFRTRSREKRGGTEYDLALSEIAEMATDAEGPEEVIGAKELARIINAWLGTLDREKRQAFVLRYFDSESVRTVALRLGRTESWAKITLMRLREALAEYLRGEGYTL
ncbi:MAG: RNA polymerase sigma factor [Lachnospiraceae bacterium]|nr:RNA polymerase sigma factor [Lachnospiraceae bacterium]